MVRGRVYRVLRYAGLSGPCGSTVAAIAAGALINTELAHTARQSG